MYISWKMTIYPLIIYAITNILKGAKSECWLLTSKTYSLTGQTDQFLDRTTHPQRHQLHKHNLLDHKASPTINHANLCPTSFSRTYSCTTPTASGLHHLTFISASVTRMSQPNNTSPTNGNPPSLDITTVLKLLPKLYELTRHSWVMIYIRFVLIFIHFL